MKTNVGITLDDAARNRLANLIDGKESKRLASRAEVCALADGFVQGLAEVHDAAELPPTMPPATPSEYHATRTREIPEKWRHKLQGKSAGYIRGFLMADARLRR